MTKKTTMPKLYTNGAKEVSDVKKVHTMLMLLLKQFNVKPKVMPIVALAKASNDSAQSMRAGEAETLTDGTEVIVPKIRISPSITDNVRAVADALAHNVVHLSMSSPFLKGSKHNEDFRDAALALGLKCELRPNDTNRNHLWTEVSLSDEQFNALVQAMGGTISFNFTAITKETGNQKPKKQKYYYIHPNGMDWVESDNGELRLYAEYNGEIRPMLKGDETAKREAEARRKEFQKRTEFVGLVG